jgi:hypothetical protein
LQLDTLFHSPLAVSSRHEQQLAIDCRHCQPCAAEFLLIAAISYRNTTNPLLGSPHPTGDPHLQSDSAGFVLFGHTSFAYLKPINDWQDTPNGKQTFCQRVHANNC